MAARWTRKAHDEKRIPPAVVSVRESSEQIAQRRTYGDGGVEEREHPSANAFRKRVGEYRGRERRIRGLANADSCACEPQLGVGLRESRDGRGDTPHGDAEWR